MRRMPIYEYRCRRCRKKSQILTLRSSEVVELRCEHCGSPELDRLMSRFAVARSDESRLDSFGDPSSLAGLDENDPRSMARWMRKMGKELGEDVAGPEFDQMVDELESGAPDDAGADADSSSDDGGE
ncbi:MAG TPA: zinc ribbon domain-containing protein [Candidatus Bathyarchaeia archaeon]|nr:zinc ribbon domain-containing protein [Candidatus Bathyarchaeia archaeon]